jgi:hypothetical protein
MELLYPFFLPAIVSKVGRCNTDQASLRLLFIAVFICTFSLTNSEITSSVKSGFYDLHV